MGNIVQFPKSEKFDRMEWLAEQLEGFNVSIIRDSHNWTGDLAFSFIGKIHEKDFPIMMEMKNLWASDEELRKLMYEYYFSIGALYYEASTSNVVSFHENQMPDWTGMA